MSDASQVLIVSIALNGATTDYEVEGTSVILGRHPDCTLVIGHPQVSRHHLKIENQSGKIYITDMGSSNGTYVDREKLIAKEAHKLTRGEVVQLGSDGPTVEIKFKEAVVAPTPPAPSKEEAPTRYEAPPSPAAKKPEPPLKKEPSVAAKFDHPAPSSPLVKTEPPPTMKSTEKEFQKIISDARKHAAKILQEAELQAEQREHAAHQRVIETEKRADRLFQDRMNEAHLEAEKFSKSSREESVALLQEARSKAKAMREQAEESSRDLRQSTEQKCEELMALAEKQSQELKEQRLAEADTIIEQKGIEILKKAQQQADEELAAHKKKIAKEREEHDKAIENERELQARTLREERARHDQEISEEKSQHRKTVDELTKEILKLEKAKDTASAKIDKYDKDLESRAAELKDLESNVKKQAVLLQEMKEEEAKALAAKQQAIREAQDEVKKIETENRSQTELKAQLKSEVERLSLTVSSLKQEKEQREQEITLQINSLKSRHESEKARMEKEEADRLNDLKLETVKSIKKLEKEMVDDILNKKSQIAQEVMLQIEATCRFLPIHEEWKKHKFDMHQMIQNILGNASQSFDSKSNPEQRVKKAASHRRREKFSAAFMGFALCGVIVWAGQYAKDRFSDSSPLKRRVASAAEARKEDLERRKFNPPQTADLKDNYVDSVIYTRSFATTYLDPAFQQEWNKAATLYLLKTWRIEEDRSTKALSISAALVKELQEQKNSIHPDFVKKGIAKMRELESPALERLKKELGGEVRLESFKKFEKKYFEKYPKK